MVGIKMSDNLFSPGPPPSASLANPTKHNWACGGGYLASSCCNCRVEAYQSGTVHTEYCEDREWGEAQFEFLVNEKKLIAARRHVATEEAIKRARTVLTAEDWDLLGIKVAPYRDIDRIIV
jgi:hypothetical protein